MTQAHEQPPTGTVITKGYEATDAHARALLLCFVVLVLTVVAVHVGVWLLLKYYRAVPRPEDEAASAIPMVVHFPDPRLQPSMDHNTLPNEDLAALRRDENELFHRMGWQIDPQTQRPVIPQQLIAELAERQAATQPSQEGSR